MFNELLRLRNETFVTPGDFEFIRPITQDNFNALMRGVVFDNRTVVLPQDDDTDGGVCVIHFYETIRALNPTKNIDIYAPEDKTHGVDSNFVEYIKANHENPYIIVTDSSSDCLEAISELSKLGDVIHIDHHQSANEVQLNELCTYHANCRYETDSRFHNLSAGFYSFLHLSCYMMECAHFKQEFVEQQFTLATLSLVADVCDLKVPYNRTIVKYFMSRTNRHVILQEFGDRYTRYDIYFLAFKVAPKLNMLFRLRYMDYIRRLITDSVKTPVVEDINIIYKNYRATVRESLNCLDVKDYSKFATTDISHINDLYPVFDRKVVNFTGWYANQLSQLLSKPVIAVCDVGDNMVKGSVRDCTDQDVYSVMDVLPYISGGGHVSAYGFTMSIGDIQYLIPHFYYTYPDLRDGKLDTIEVHSLLEIDNIAKHGVLAEFAEYNDYTINDKIGFLYKLKFSDSFERFNNRTLIGKGTVKIICFDDNPQPKDTIKLIPDTTSTGIQLIANIVERAERG